MKTSELNILKLKQKLTYQKKNEIKYKILKSIIQCNKITPIYQNYARLLLSKRKISFLKFKHICLKNNRGSSVYNDFFLSKYCIKNLMLKNTAQNIKLNSW